MTSYLPASPKIFILNARVSHSLILLMTLMTLSAFGAQPAPKPAAHTAELDSTIEGKALRAAWETAQYAFPPEVRRAFLVYAKSQTKRDLAASGKTLPDDFLAWIDSDPVVEATVYGARQAPTNVLLQLRSLELDLGQDAVRKKYTQLALAMAVVHAKDGPIADLSPRDTLELVISGNPLKPVDTKDPSRTLDVNDHIINFLNEHAPLEREVKVGGTAKAPVMEKKKFPLVAADVLASRQLQTEFNAYMKEKGQAVEINCGDHIIYPDLHDMIRGPESKDILKAYHLFRTAYEAKGLLPAKRDPAPTPAEHCAFLIRNNEYKFPAGVKREWPRFPLSAPWPLMTLLAANDQSLRESEDIWLRYRDKGEFHGYGEYIGSVAQQFDFQSARRLSPYPWTYGTIQMMFKDGGVCGTMANIAARSHSILGEPSCTAGQPGHCALITYHFNDKSKAYELRGEQFVTGGPAQTHPHTPWFFGDVDAREDMVYHESIAWAVNAGFQSYLDSTLAYDLHRLLPIADRKAHGQQLLESALTLNPYNFLLADAAQADAATPLAQVRFWKVLHAALASLPAKPGCPVDSLYSQTVHSRLFAHLAKLPPPADKDAARQIYAFLQEEKCDNTNALAVYQVAAEGLPALLTRTEAEFKAHLASVRTEATCEKMTGALDAAVQHLTDKKQKAQWILERWQEIQGHEYYLDPKNNFVIDSMAHALAKLSAKKLRPESEMTQAILDEVKSSLKSVLEKDRDAKSSQHFAGKIAAVGAQIKDDTQKRQWAESLSKVIAGHEEYQPKNAKKDNKPLRDPCADAIAKLLAAPAAAAEVSK